MKIQDLLNEAKVNFFVDEGTITSIEGENNSFGNSLKIEIDTGRQYPKKVWLPYSSKLYPAKKYFPFIQSMVNLDVEVSLTDDFTIKNPEIIEQLVGRKVAVITYKNGKGYRTNKMLYANIQQAKEQGLKDKFLQKQINSITVSSNNNGETLENPEPETIAEIPDDDVI